MDEKNNSDVVVDEKQAWFKELERMGFVSDKPDLFYKRVNGGVANWDFRKSSKGRFYVSLDGGGFESDNLSHQREEYICFRRFQGQDVKKDVKSDKHVISSDSGEGLVMRGDESHVSRVVLSRRLDVIARVSSDGCGEGVLYHNLGGELGFEPSAELIDMITCDMGGIETEIVSLKESKHVDVDGDEYYTYACVVRARDIRTGTTGLGAAEEVIDFKELESGRSFAMAKAVRKAERNAKERLIPVPRRALVELVKLLVSEGRRR